jgi:hypothetical protein
LGDVTRARAWVEAVAGNGLEGPPVAGGGYACAHDVPETVRIDVAVDQSVVGVIASRVFEPAPIAGRVRHADCLVAFHAAAKKSARYRFRDRVGRLPPRLRLKDDAV